MPSPRAGESRDDFLDRCIPEVVAEGREPDQAVAMCLAYYEGEKDKAFDLDKMGAVEYWKAFNRKRESFQSKYERVLIRAIKDQLQVFEGASTIQDLRKELREEPMKEAFVDLYTTVGDSFARSTYSGLKKMPYTETKQDPVWIERMRKFALIDASGRILGINKTTKKKINSIIVQGLEEGLSVPEIRNQIIGTTALPALNGTIRQRATRIARTEIISASNAGSLEGAKSTGLNPKKQWLSTMDTRTREDHVIVDGQIQNLDDPFNVVGEDLQYPGDPAGSPGNVINCRCTQIYITED
jgi:uncharacterized protein with gpF-like domain